MSASAQKALFGEVGSLSSVMVEHADHMETERREQLRIPQAQESLLIDELIGSFLGLEGQFIKTVMDEGASPLNRAAMHGFQFQLLEPESEEVRFGTILRNVAEQVLPLATSFARVRYFIAQHEPGYEYGSAMQAFCEAVNRMIQDHISAMSSLDGHYRRQDLTLRTLQVHVRPSMHSMSVLERACDAVRQKKGGALINALRELKLQCYEGDETADRILQALQDAAAVPYLTTLRQWLESGVLSDPYEEFMVQRNSGSETWEDKFEVVEDHVLEGFFSTQQTVDRVLATGRYWHAVRSWQQSEKVSKEKKESEATIADLRYSMNFATVSAYVGNLYQKASRALVMLLMEDFDLIDSLRIAKRYFLLEHGDLFVNFLDAAEEELLKDVQHLSQGRIQHWLNVSVQMTEHSGEAEGSVGTPQRRRRTITPSGIRCRFAGESLLGHLDQLHSASGGIDTHDPWTPVRHTYGGSVTSSEDITGLDAFVIDFASVPFPTSLVFSRQALACYQLLFRHLFFAKHVERRLVSIWRDHQSMKELQSLRGSMGPTFLLRQRMLHFLQNLIYYMMFEVIEPNWLEMESAISASLTSKEQTVDDILRHHGQFLRRALEACLLTNRDLVRALTKIMKTCLLFTDQMKRFMKATKIEEDRNFVATEKQKLVHRNLNARGGTRTSRLSYKRLHETMVNDRIERQRRVHRQTVRVEREVSGESYQRMVTRFEEVFSDNLREFMVQLTRSDDLFHTHKVNLCVRLDYNGYVTDAMGLNER
jgi:gamma-tubulin complex component 2